MFNGDRSRKQTLVDFGFRLPSALDNRPLRFEEWESHLHQAVFVSATPGPFEYEHSDNVVEQIIRPTGLIDPVIHVRPSKGQIDDLLGEIKGRIEHGERALVTTLTKRMAEDLSDYLKEMGIRTQYIHADIDTIERVEILRDLRLGIYDVVVGINLLREGLDLPEVSLVAILDADKEGYLRSSSALIQTVGRAARHVDGTVLMYADRITNSMDIAIKETQRRRDIQTQYNKNSWHRATEHHQASTRPDKPTSQGRGRTGSLRGREIWTDQRTEGRIASSDQRSRKTDEGCSQEPGVRESCPAARPGCRTAAYPCARGLRRFPA